MARPLRIAYEGALYHLTSRGNEKHDIYRSDQDRRYFLRTLSEVIHRFKWVCYAYCLMTNHYHLLVETPLANVSDGMRQLNSVYSSYFNRIHRRVGHLFQGRFKGILVEKQAYALELCRYVPLNPVRAGVCSDPGVYPWSSYQATKGRIPRPSFLNVDWALQQFANDPSVAQLRYERFVMDGIGKCPWDDLKGQIYLGSEAFIQNLQDHGIESPEIPKIQRQPLRPALSDLLKTEEGMLEAFEKHGYRIKEIADSSRVHYATICRRMQRLKKTSKSLLLAGVGSNA